jgi:hypothetical protein
MSSALFLLPSHKLRLKVSLVKSLRSHLCVAAQETFGQEQARVERLVLQPKSQPKSHSSCWSVRKLACLSTAMTPSKNTSRPVLPLVFLVARLAPLGGIAQRDVAPQELDQDLKELRAEGSTRLQFAEQTEREIEEERAKSLAAVGIDPDAPLGLEAPDVPLALPAPETVDIAPETTIAEDEFANLSFDKAQYERVLQQVKADITTNKPINIPAIQQRVKSDIPGIKVSQVRDIMNELKARGFVAENPASKKNKFIPMGSLAPEVKTPDVSYRRQIDSASDFIKADQTRLERLQYDLRSAEAYGRDLEGNRVTPNQVNATIARVEQRIAEKPTAH